MEKWTDDQIRELCEKATEGPWWNESCIIHAPYNSTTNVHPAKCAEWEDAEFIAAARELVPQLLDRAQKAEQVISSIVNLANDGKSVAFAEDWGDNTLTVQVDDAHTHVGAPEGSLGNLIKDLHALFVEGKGLNWVGQEGETDKVANHPIWRDRALKAEAELRRCYKDLEQLTAERDDLKAMLADAGLRNAVLGKRIDRLLDVIHDDCECESFEVCINRVSGTDCATGYDCKKCWHAWLEQEVQL